jgi:lysyl-tRNA synthetase class 1
MGKQPPQGFFYEMFLDETGKKISKKVGRGLTVDTWMDYAPVESLLYYIFQNPRKAKRLYWELVPRVVDDYLESLRNWPKVPSGKRPDSVLWHIFERGTKVPDYEADVDYSMVHNLLSAVGAAASEEIILEYLEAYDHKVAEYKDFVRTLVDKSLKYYRDFILPGKRYKTPNAEEKQILREMRNAAAAVEDWEDERTLQGVPFYIAEKFDIAAPEVFRLFYEVMLGQERGPRFGSFARLAGKERLLNLFDEKLRGKVGN